MHGVFSTQITSSGTQKWSLQCSKHSWDVKTIQQTGYLNNHPTVYSLNISAVKLCIYNSIKINIGFQFTVAAISKHF